MTIVKFQQSRVWVSFGIAFLTLMLIPWSANAQAATACPSEIKNVVRMVGGRKFKIDAGIPMSVRTEWRDSHCLLWQQRRGLDSVSEPYSGKISEQSGLGGSPLIIVIDDFGYRNDWVVDGFLNLDFAVTFAVLPGHQFSAETATRAYRSGYEVLVHMPMQALRPAPGELEYRLTTAMSSTQITRRVRQAISEIPEAIGMNNHQGSAATGDVRVMDTVAAELREQGMFFFDSVTSAESVAVPVMLAAGVPVIRRDLFLDSVDDVAYVLAQLDRLVEIADGKGYAVGIGHVRPNTLLALQQATPGLKANSHQFTYLSALAKNHP